MTNLRDGSIVAPWTPEQVAALNAWQRLEHMHPFTCGNDRCRSVLIATAQGWICPKDDYAQTWAHDFMGDTALHPPDPANNWWGISMGTEE